jgi:hypothetical protein
MTARTLGLIGLKMCSIPDPIKLILASISPTKVFWVVIGRVIVPVQAVHSRWPGADESF